MWPCDTIEELDDLPVQFFAGRCVEVLEMHGG